MFNFGSFCGGTIVAAGGPRRAGGCSESLRVVVFTLAPEDLPIGAYLSTAAFGGCGYPLPSELAKHQQGSGESAGLARRVRCHGRGGPRHQSGEGAPAADRLYPYILKPSWNLFDLLTDC